MFNLKNILLESEMDELGMDNDHATVTVDTDTNDDTVTFDTIFIDDEIGDVFERTCPISGCVSEELQECMADPNNLRIVAEGHQYYMDYNELANFMEARNSSIASSLNAIFEHYNNAGHRLGKENFNIVFPSKSVLQEMYNELGYKEVKYSSELLKRCINLGVKCCTAGE